MSRAGQAAGSLRATRCVGLARKRQSDTPRSQRRGWAKKPEPQGDVFLGRYSAESAAVANTTWNGTQ